jgi:hypothetical protein
MAATLLIAVGTGVVANLAGLSMALGAFIAGLMLAETEYRRAIEAIIEPFKGLLLGTFFLVVGLKLDLDTRAGCDRTPAVTLLGVQARNEAAQRLRVHTHLAAHTLRQRHGDLVDVEAKALAVPLHAAGPDHKLACAALDP